LKETNEDRADERCQTTYSSDMLMYVNCQSKQLVIFNLANAIHNYVCFKSMLSRNGLKF